MLPHTHDILIIGAGPSGCACALALQGKGWRVALVEKETFPRDKICGDAIPGGAFKAMDRIHQDWGKAMRSFADSIDINVSTAFFPGGKKITLQWSAKAYNSRRNSFDHFLFQLVRSQTDTDIFENNLIQQLESTVEGVYCTLENNTRLSAPLVIGCDGAYSIVKRKLLHSTDSNDESCAAVRAYATGVKGVKDNVNEFHFFNDFMPGYFWIFPVGEGVVNIGFGMLQKKSQKQTKTVNLRESLQQIITQFPEMADRFKDAKLETEIKGFSLPLGTQKIKASGERFMLCGDAASLIDPLQGHGIDKAMWSGLFAAQQAHDCLLAQNFSAVFMQRYDRLLDKHIGAELKKNTFIMRTLAKYPFTVTVLAAIAKRQKSIQWLAKVLKI